MTIDILRRHGGWCIELQYPLHSHTGEITAIEIRRPTADVIIRWGDRQIHSTLGLLTELCGVPENVLRQLPSDDFDRVLFALLNILPGSLKSELQEGGRPLATPDELLPVSAQIPPPDQLDPRFPAVNGPVQRIPREPVANNSGGMNLSAPPATLPVH
jgi:hypothetical protein